MALKARGDELRNLQFSFRPTLSTRIRPDARKLFNNAERHHAWHIGLETVVHAVVVPTPRRIGPAPCAAAPSDEPARGPPALISVELQPDFLKQATGPLRHCRFDGRWRFVSRALMLMWRSDAGGPAGVRGLPAECSPECRRLAQ
jgi:hypothetical protein